MASSSPSGALQETLTLLDTDGTPQTTSEVAGNLDIGRRSTYNRLNRLVEQGYLETKKVGGNGRVWWRPVDEPVAGGPNWNGITDSLVTGLTGTDVAVFVVDEADTVRWVNDATEQFFGFDTETVLGMERCHLVENRIAPRIEDPETFTERLLSPEGADTEQSRWQVTAGPDREQRSLAYRSELIETGSFAGGRIELYHDVTGQRCSDRFQCKAGKQFDQLADVVGEYAICTLDTEGRVQTWSDGARQITGYEAEEIVGDHVSTFYTADDRDDGVPEWNLSVAATHGSIEDEGWRLRKDGSRFWANNTITAVCDDTGDLDGYLTVTRAMTDRTEHEKSLGEQTGRIETREDAPDTELDEIFERIDDAFCALNEQFEFEYVNDSAAAHFGKSERDLLGQKIWNALDVADTDPIIDRFETAMATQKTVSFERYSEVLDFWASVTVYPSMTGLSIYFRDISDGKERERRLQRYEQTIETIWDGVMTIDDDDRFLMVNEAVCEMTGYSRDELLGERISRILPETVTEEARGLNEAVPGGDQEFASLEFDLNTADGETIPVESRFGPYELEDGSTGRTGVVRDVSGRLERERELEESERRYRTLIENFPDGSVGLFDQDLCYTTVGGELLDRLGVDPANRVGERISELYSDELIEQIKPYFEQVFEGESNSAEIEYRTRCLLIKTLPVEDADGTVFAGMLVVQDITERKEREQKLRESEQRYRTLVENFPNGAVALVDEELQYVTVGGHPLEEAETTIDELEGTPLQETLQPEIADFLLPNYEAALDGETRKVVHEIGDHIYQFHFIPVRDCDGEVFAALGMSQDITADRERQRELERHREQLEALNNLNDTVREITDAVINQSTREEIESIVCEHLADSDSYEFAWIGDVNVPTQTVNLRTEAGVDGYLDGTTISVDPDDVHSLGPTGRALRTGELQVAQDVRTDANYQPWQDHVEAYNFHSSAAIPLVHDDSIYGVLNVYADRKKAFENQERTVIRQLGEIIGHAIAATERKRALMSDDVIELQFRIQNLFDALDIEGTAQGKITIDHTIPIGNDEFLIYGTATPDAIDSADSIVETVPHWVEVNYRNDEGTTAFELRVSDPPVLSKVAAMGGSIENAVIEDGDYWMTFHVTPSADIRQIIDTVEKTYPTAEMVKRQQTVRRDRMRGLELNDIISELTDRQQTCLETAVYSGYFEWPRDASAEDVARSIGVSPPTFHEHLRKAEKNVFSSLYSSPVVATE
jgi:PAS domain S-box-containing protein